MKCKDYFYFLHIFKILKIEHKTSNSIIHLQIQNVHERKTFTLSKMKV